MSHSVRRARPHGRRPAHCRYGIRRPRSVTRPPRCPRCGSGTPRFATSPRVVVSDVTLRQLRYFAVLGEELNYSRAAERLFITQPALSTAIKSLEHSFGVVL